MSVRNTYISGDLVVGRNVTMGGTLNVSGNTEIGHDLVVKGWLDAPNIRSVNKGLFTTKANLVSSYPTPENGWIAYVGTEPPYAIYVCASGEWIGTPGRGYIEGIGDEVAAQVEVNKGDISGLKSRVSSAEEGISANGTLISGLKSRVSSAEEGISANGTLISGLSAGLSLLSGVVSRSGVPISSASLEDSIASNNKADKNHHSIRFGRVTDDAITAVGYGITGSIMGTYLNVLWSTALHRFVAYDSTSGLYYSEWSGPNIPSSSSYTLVSSSRPEEQSTPHYDKVYIDNAGGVYAYSSSKRSLVTADIDLSYLTGVSGIEMSSGGTLDMGLGSITKVDSLVMSGAGSGSISNVKHLTMYAGGELNMSGGTISSVSRIDMSGSGLLNGVQKLYFVDNGEAEIDLMQGKIQGVQTLEMLTGVTSNIENVSGIYMSTGGTISGASRIDMSSGTISEVATLSFKSGGTLAPSVIGVQEIFGKNNVHISMSGSTTGDGIDFGGAPLKNINGIVMSTSGIISGTLQGTIQSTTFSSGNTFTTGFIDELKTALGIS